jgi:hypothetical protein
MKTNTPTSAAEALKQSKSGMITHKAWDPRDKDIVTFNKDEKVWYNGERFWTNPGCLLEPVWLPYDPEPVDQELLDAQKRFPVGSWYCNKWEDKTLFQVGLVYRNKNTNGIRIERSRKQDSHSLEACTPFPLWISESRCVVDDVPKEDGFYLIVGTRTESKYSVIAIYSGGWNYDEHKGDVWYHLPKQGGE